MRGKNYNVGLRGVLFEARHYARMGQAVWLFGWLVLRETREREGVGFVLGGRPVTYREIEEETGFSRKSLERWMRSLRKAGYIETTTAPGGIIVRIQKAKKFVRCGSSESPRQFPHGPKESEGNLWKTGGAGQPLLGFAGTRLKSEETSPQICASSRRKHEESVAVAQGIGSGAVGREIERQNQISPSFFLQRKPEEVENPRRCRRDAATVLAGTSTSVTRRTFRSDEVSRELRVGAGPEARP